MKTSFFSFLLLCACIFQIYGADVTLIPPRLNNVLTKIQPGMTIQEVKHALSTSYPKITDRPGLWSGFPPGAGYVDYALDGRFELSVSSTIHDGKTVVRDDLLFIVRDLSAKPCVNIAIYNWDKPASSLSPNK